MFMLKTEKEIIIYPIVRFKNFENNGEVQFAIDQTGHYYNEEYEKGEPVTEKVYTVFESFDPVVLQGWSFGDSQVEELDRVGEFHYEINDETIKWNTFNALVDFPHLKPLENRKAEILLAGNVSAVADLRFIQWTDDIVMGYTTIMKDDIFNQKEPHRFNKISANIYFFYKIGFFTKENKEIGIYRYVSDMSSCPMLGNEINWMKGTGTFEKSNNESEITQKIR